MKPVSKDFLDRKKNEHHSSRDLERQRLREDKKYKKEIKARNKGLGKKAWEEEIEKRKQRGL